MRKRRKLIIKSKKHGLTRREKIKEQLVDIESELLKSHNDDRLHDENKALDRIKSDPNYFFKYGLTRREKIKEQLVDIESELFQLFLQVCKEIFKICC